MSNKEDFQSMEEAKSLLGDDFWEILSEVIPFVGPKIDMCKTEKELLIVAEIPGIQSPQDILIRIDGYSLILEGELNRPYGIDKKFLVKKERYTGPFKRKLQLPYECIVTQMEAVYKKGLLYIKIPIVSQTAFTTQEIPITFKDEFSGNVGRSND